MRGQLITLSNQTGKLVISIMFTFVIVGAFVAADLITNTNPFWSAWQKVLQYSVVVYGLIAIGVLVMLWKVYQMYL